MEAGPDRRQHTRLNLDDRFTVRFEVGYKVFRSVPMTNVSIGGVGLRMEMANLAPIQAGTLLRNLVMEHPTLPNQRIDSEVRHILGQQGGRTEGPVFLGVQFVNPPEALVRILEQYVEKGLLG